MVRVSDVAQVELGAQTYSASAKLNGAPSATLAVYLAPGANALAVGNAVRARVAELSRNFPDRAAYTIVYDTNRFVTAPIPEILSESTSSVDALRLVAGERVLGLARCDAGGAVPADIRPSILGERQEEQDRR